MVRSEIEVSTRIVLHQSYPSIFRVTYTMVEKYSSIECKRNRTLVCSPLSLKTNKCFSVKNMSTNGIVNLDVTTAVNRMEF